MGVVILDGSTIRAFVSADADFRRFVDQCFASFDVNKDGVLSRSELRHGLETFHLTETHFGVGVITPPDQIAALYDSIFGQFDQDHSGTVDLDEFRSEMRRIMLVVADGLGSVPIQVALEDGEDSFLKKVADLAAAKIGAAACHQ